MQVTNRVINGTQVFNKTGWNAIQKLGEIKFPIKTSLAIARLSLKLMEAEKPIAKVWKDIDAQTEKEKAALRSEYYPLKKDEKQQDIPLTEEQTNDYAEKLRGIDTEHENRVNELMDTEVEFDLKDKIKLPDTLEIESNILAVLEPFIEV